MGLFNTTNNFHRHTTETRYVNRDVSVTEHKAPTDESVRLFDEFLDKAKSRMVASVTINSNIISCHAMYFSTDYCVGERYEVWLRYELNGEVYQLRSTLDYFDFEVNEATIIDTLKLVYEHVAKVLADEFVTKSQHHIIDNLTGKTW